MRYRKLFLGDLLRRLAKHLGVLKRDVREQDDLGVDDVGRIESPAEPGLDDGDGDLLLGELGDRAAIVRVAVDLPFVPTT
jgi:hypothetical protein